MYRSMLPRTGLVFICLLCATPTVAEPSLPGEGVDLPLLDLNGAPFRHFHLQKFPGIVINKDKQEDIAVTGRKTGLSPSRAEADDEVLRELSRETLKSSEFQYSYQPETLPLPSGEELRDMSIKPARPGSDY